MNFFKMSQHSWQQMFQCLAIYCEERFRVNAGEAVTIPEKMR